ncbi:MAG: toll/interleukin-1 receptor domain-containing protein, partial [Bacilli bacterium]|nr:toll/interleukin-1 receptor domain-containing protein [Bacilli bacterium]
MADNDLEPFKILVLWDSEFNDGINYAQEIFDTFYRHENDYSGESIGIPVKFITDTKYNIDKELKGCEYVAIVVLIDNKMLVQIKRWQSILEKICKICSDKIRLYPVCFCGSKAISNMPADLGRKNFITFDSLGTIPDFNKRLNKRIEYLIFELAHEFSRLLYGYNRVNDLECDTTPAGINIFISHSREDGKKYAQDFNTYLTTNTSLDRFIDVFDIYKGEDIEGAINNKLKSAALLVLCTDSYSSREWCQHEVLYAKSKKRPILLVDMLKNGEKRRFPYMANIKTMHLDYGAISDEQKRNIILNILFEVLRVKYSELKLSYLCKIFSIDNISIFPYPPELLTLMNERKEHSDLKTVLYPEPPLNKREQEILSVSMPEMNFFTPTFLLLKNETLKGSSFSDVTIGLSASEISEKSLSKTNAQLKIMVVELSRYLI